MRAAYFVWSVCAALVATALTLLVLSHGLIGDLGIVVGLSTVTLALLVFATIGIVIRRHQPANRIAWAYLTGGMLSAFQFTAGAYAGYSQVHGKPELARYSAWLLNWLQFPGIFFVLVLGLFIFPDGRLPTRIWRMPLGVVACAMAVSAIATALAPGPLSRQVRDPLFALTNPVGLGGAPGRLATVVATYGLAVIPASLVVACIALGVRYLGAEPAVRRQIKWLAYPIAVVFALLTSFAVIPNPGATVESIEALLFGFAVLSIPVGAGVGILKHRFYDIDLIISRTLVYGGLAAFVTACYLLVVVGVGTVTGTRFSLSLSVVATALAAVAFQPVRVRLTRLANRLVWGERAGPLEVLTRLSQAMAGAHELDQVLSTTARVITTGVGATRGVVWLRQGSELVPAAQWPLTSAGLPEPILVREQAVPHIENKQLWYPVRHNGELIGALSITMPPGQELPTTEDKQLSQLAWTAGLVLENVRLIDQLRASRARILAAQDAERRRIERDLHDGAQQRLVNVSLAIGMARAVAAPLDAPHLTAVLDRAGAEAQEAVRELRDLARGVHPAILTDCGLLPAVRTLVERSAIPATIQSTAREERYASEVEATAYFVVAESLTNAAKHAAAERINIDIARANGQLVVQIRDDGRGGAAIRVDGGLQGLADRIAALGGRFELDSPPRDGTRVKAVLPCA